MGRRLEKKRRAGAWTERRYEKKRRPGARMGRRLKKMRRALMRKRLVKKRRA
jgi:hypothetical protein